MPLRSRREIELEIQRAEQYIQGNQEQIRHLQSQNSRAQSFIENRKQELRDAIKRERKLVMAGRTEGKYAVGHYGVVLVRDEKGIERFMPKSAYVLMQRARRKVTLLEEGRTVAEIKGRRGMR